ncbi:nucleotidyl transferase AbiEii/AbiGii toxin family protein [Pantoea endophytica]|uniref:nucleotidyl transferase AbiEii/AbiGii toxin family protein n=1 Tax=Pantoea endophytica TaxID=92488 RepID=UPI0024131E55|nr:nucleotidyl transferase AbiEii/AbiGii toxin family protein [Pantoea endophytica]
MGDVIFSTNHHSTNLVKHWPLYLPTEQLLCKIDTICRTQGIPYFIAGATSREILIHHVYGRPVGRRTRDVDFAVFVKEWALFDALRQRLCEAGAQAVKGNAHRMILDGIELDIIPFGGVAEANKGAWPPDRDAVMAVDGFEEAFRHTVLVKVAPDRPVPFCSLPGLALLKLFAWRDRGTGNSKDAVDLYKIIVKYGVIEEDRIYDWPVEGNALEWNTLRMGAYLLGSDMAVITSADSIKKLLTLDIEKLTDAVVRQSRSESPEEIEKVLEDFWAGIQHSE